MKISKKEWRCLVFGMIIGILGLMYHHIAATIIGAGLAVYPIVKEIN